MSTSQNQGDTQPGTDPELGQYIIDDQGRARPASGGAATSSGSAPKAQEGWERTVLEKLVMEGLQEQRRARRWKVGLRLAWLGFLLLIFWTLFHRSAPSTAPTHDHTAVIEIKGEISEESLLTAEEYKSLTA